MKFAFHAVPVFFASIVLGQSVETKGKIEAVTVYRGQALVARTVELAGKAGLREIVVTDLPSRVLPGSLYAEGSLGGGGVVVRSVQFRTRPVSQDVNESVRRLDADLQTLQDSLASNQASVMRLDEQKAYLDKMEMFVVPTAQTEMSKGVLNAETLIKLSDFSGKQRDTISLRRLELAKETRGIQSQIELKRRERTALTAGSSRTVNEAVVFLNKDGDGPSTMRVRYLVDAATWSPSYNVRGDAKAGQVTLEYFASVEQVSGEDWEGVQLELSTATPALIAKAPTLTPMSVALAAPAPSAVRYAYADAKKELADKQRDTERNRSLSNSQNQAAAQSDASGRLELIQQTAGGGGGSAPRGDDNWAGLAMNDKNLNEIASQSLILDVLASEKDVKPSGSKGSGRGGSAWPNSEEGLSVTYTLSGRTSVPSRMDRQLIQIASMPMKAEFVKVATPSLTQFVYDEAHLTNVGGMVLLAGPLTAYSGGSFMGNGALPTVAAGEQFSLGFGIDSSLRAGRELVDKTEVISGGNRVVTLTYRLTVENFATTPAKVRLSERLPKVRENEIKLTMVSATPQPVPMSQNENEDTSREAKNKKNGLVKWELDVPPQAIGSKAAVVEYAFKLEYDKQMTVVGTDSGQPILPPAPAAPAPGPK